MGGNAFPQIDLVRIKKEDIPATVYYVVDTLGLTNLTYDYAMNSLMGSSNKKATSGDLDICMNTHKARFVGEVDRPVFNKHNTLERVMKVLPKERINTQTFRMGNLMMAWPIAGDENNGFVQVDFVFGKFEILQFTHYSPAEGESEFKGVFLSQALGILAKMHKDWELYDEVNDERIARAGLHLSLEHGLFRSWEARRRIGMGASKCTPDEFETRFANAPRLTRIGYVDCPDEILRILFRANVTHEEINTFEKFLNVFYKYHGDRYDEFYERFIFSAGGSQISKANDYDKEWLTNHPIWTANSRSLSCQSHIKK